MRGLLTTPRGFVYETEAISQRGEAALIEQIEAADLQNFMMNGNVVKRMVRTYGYRYDYDNHQIELAEPIPSWLMPVVERAEMMAGLDRGDIAQILLQKYPVGANISWHKDKPQFGSIVGLSLGSFCIMQFQRGTGDEREVYERFLNPRSMYVLSGDVRHEWEHHIPPAIMPRYSITLRTLVDILLQ